MATDVQVQSAPRVVRRPTTYVMPAVATLLLVALALWLGINFYKGPAYFFTIFFIGLTNGAMYALVAIGYTLVYGILELINFAHGDVFMLGGMISATMLLSVLHLNGQRAGTCSRGDRLVARVAMVFCGVLNAGDRAGRVPTAARTRPDSRR